ncbi:MAG: T9SS type A sorting domain-containing protein [candidate division WOR-3 bacterium]
MRISFIFLFFIGHWALGIIPLPPSPSWQSSDNDYATGGGFGDIDTNGFIDYVTSNGNDMASNRNAVYFNRNGILETNAGWRSQDQGYFGHLYLGDINQDRLLDLAVVYLGYGSNQGATRIYRNRGGGLENSPYWQSADRYNSFDCCFGDIDLDGDLDLAVAAGDAYNNIRSPVRIYRNNQGIFETNPYWTSLDSQPSDALRFLDINNDGFLDLVVGYRRKVAIYINNNGTLPRQPTFSFREKGWVLRIAIGDYDRDGWVDFALASNGQLSGDSSRIKVFKNRNGMIDTIPVFQMLRNTRYASCVAFGDCNGDGFLELAAGGWWEPICVFENRNGVLDTLPTWSYSMGNNLVCEMIMWGCFGNDHLQNETFSAIGDGQRKLFLIPNTAVQFLRSVKINSSPLPDSLFAFDFLSGYFSLRHPLTNSETLKIDYTYSPYGDLGVTNWDQPSGNLLFLNTSPPVGIAAKGDLRKTKSHSLLLEEVKGEVKIWDASGRVVKKFSVPDSKKISLIGLKPGIYFVNGKKVIKL